MTSLTASQRVHVRELIAEETAALAARVASLEAEVAARAEAPRFEINSEPEHWQLMWELLCRDIARSDVVIIPPKDAPP